ncbi:MAG: TMEM165/GDT1 family protein [Candidatus Rokubacteria bacterium]|nr:TMEM165/GDT1 family protein [Candidatus Rokubacteria bacterium]
MALVSILWSSFAMVALGEMGDKTQLVALSLAARYRRPWTVMLGILLATLANHALASSVGVWVAAMIPATTLGWIVGLGFIAFGIWALFPDSAQEPGEREGWGPLITTTVVFFIVEMGDKTQLATVALGARFHSVLAVTAGTTAGMLGADGLAVWAGSRLGSLLPMRRLRWAAAALFIAFGLAALAGVLV